MARKPERIWHLMEREKKTGKVVHERPLVRGLYRVGCFHKDDVKKHFHNISKRRFDLMVKGGFIKKTGNYYILGDEGKKYCENKMDMKYKYKFKEENIKHNAKLSKVYLSIPEKQRETWKTETQKRYELTNTPGYKDMYYDSKFENSPRKNFIIDATIYSKELQQEIAVEVLTSQYSADDVSQKQETGDRFFNGHIYYYYY